MATVLAAVGVALPLTLAPLPAKAHPDSFDHGDVTAVASVWEDPSGLRYFRLGVVFCPEGYVRPCIEGWGEQYGALDFDEDLNSFSVVDRRTDGHYIWGAVEECVLDYFGGCDWTRVARVRAASGTGWVGTDVRDIPDNRTFRVTLCMSKYHNPQPGAYVRCSGWVDSRMG